ncbi:MAG: hypothetical protein IKG53_01430 [Solobacterium sp.]|nr:hypothetical protein [Solobacterium sp.]
MKLYTASLDYAARHGSELQQLRLKGNMICLYGDCSRRAMKLEHIREGNVFAADNGEFIFSGCYSLYDVRSVYLPEVIRILKEKGVSYAFRLEDPAACGGTLDHAVSDPALSNDRYTYVVRFKDETEKDAVMPECRQYCTFHFLDPLNAYLIFNDSDPKKAVLSIHDAIRVKEEDIIFLSEDSEL